MPGRGGGFKIQETGGEDARRGAPTWKGAVLGVGAVAAAVTAPLGRAVAGRVPLGQP